MAQRCIRSFLKNDINPVIMDINLPWAKRFLARELREQANVALMFLTGRDNEVDKIWPGNRADDYITKPFNPRELTIRARNPLSRTMNPARSAKSVVASIATNSTAGNLISIAVR